MFADNSTETVVVSKALPAGNYILHAKINIVNNTGGPRRVDCSFTAPVIDHTRVLVDESSRGSPIAEAVLLSWASFSEPTTVRVLCFSDFSENPFASLNVETNLAAITVGNLQVDRDPGP